MVKLHIWALAALAVLLAATSASAEPIKLKFANATSVTDRYTAWIDKVNEDAAGTIEISLYGRDTPLGKSVLRQLAQVKDGTADIAIVITSFHSDIFPDDDVSEVPFLFENAAEGSVVMKRLAESGRLRGYDDFQIVGGWVDADRWLHTNFPVASLEALRGRNIRVPGEFTTPVVQALGANPVSLSPAKAPDAFRSGRIDGIFNIIRGMYLRRIMEFVDYHVEAPLGRAFLVVVMNKAKYDSLPEVAKVAIARHSGDDLSRSWGESLQAQHDELLEKLRATPGHVIRSLTPDEKKQWQSATQTAIEIWIAADPQRRNALDAARLEVERLRAGG